MKKLLHIPHNITAVAVTLLYEPEYSTEEVQVHVHTAVEANLSFYEGYGGIPTDLTITLLTHRSQYDAILGYTSSSWGSGITRGSHIYTFHPDRRALVTSHSKESFVNTLTHEVCHVFSRSIFGDELWWVREGVAQYLAKQQELKILDPNSVEHFILQSLDKNIAYSEFVNTYQGHQISRRMGYAIGELYGSAVLRSLQELKPGDTHTRERIATTLQVPLEKLNEHVRSLLNSNNLTQATYTKQKAH